MEERVGDAVGVFVRFFIFSAMSVSPYYRGAFPELGAY